VRIAAANAGILHATCSWLVALSVVGLSGCALLGCATDHQQVKSISSPRPSIPLPSQALLTPQPDPECALKDVAIEERSDKPPDVNPSDSGHSATAPGAAPQPSTHLLGQLIKLEYERNCFQRAEWRARSRLLRLQTAVAKTIKAAKRVSQNTGSGP
jgi:hypothetical protein